MKPTIVDSDAQLGIGETWGSPARSVAYGVEALLERSGEAGVDRSCVMAPRNPVYDLPNRKVAEWCGKYPDKLIGFAVHNPQRETGRLRPALIEEVKALGLKGVRSDGHPTRELLDVVVGRRRRIEYSGDILPRPQ